MKEKKIYSFLFSTRLMAILFLGFAVAMATGTFIESKYNTDTARIWIYNSWWLEGIMLIFMINFFGNIKRYQLYKKEKWATLALHLAFIFIIAGAFITRYISYEGMMRIREGETSNQFLYEKGDVYLKLVESGGGSRHEHMLKEGEIQNIHNVLFAVNKPTPGAINIDTKNNTITSPFDGQFM